MSNIVLLGDSVFDNGVYVDSGEPDVAEQLQSLLSLDDDVTLLAVDGDLTTNVPTQLKQLPESATHLVLSVGGNDALGYLNVLERLEESVGTVGEAIGRLKDIQTDFRESYDAMLDEVLKRNLPTCMCTIYNGNFEDVVLQEYVDTILPVINEVIVDAAVRNGLPLIDLGRVCDQKIDYANPIEPSAHGGEKIVRSIRRVLKNHDFQSPRTEVFAGNV